MRTEREEHVDAGTQQKSLKKRNFPDVSDTSSGLPHIETLPLGGPPANSSDTRSGLMNAIVVIDSRSLTRDCLVCALRTITDTPILSLPTVEAWLAVGDKVPASAILLCISGRNRDPDTPRQLAVIEQISDCIPMLILGETEDPDQIMEFLERGVRGYIPTSMALSVTLQTLRLVAAGGMFVPASSLVASYRQRARSGHAGKDELDMFTSRQAAVVAAVCLGKPNKVIAYELAMCESTVKVHVRNIMKKLKAKNRTEVAMIVKGRHNDSHLKIMDHRQRTL